MNDDHFGYKQKIPKTNTDQQATAANLQQTLVLYFFLLL
jgi:hypothetical protein